MQTWKNLIPFVALLTVTPAFAGNVELMQAILDAKPDEVTRILGDPSQNIDLNAPSKEGVTVKWTPLTLAAAKGDLQSVQLLIEKGADLHAGFVDHGKRVSPFLLAAMYDRKEVMKAILNRPQFGEDGYENEIKVAALFPQPKLVEELKTARDAQIQAEKSKARLSATPLVVAEETCQHEGMKQFPGDLMAQIHDNFCPICTEVPGASEPREFLNEQKRNGSMFVAECGKSYCKKCLESSLEPKEMSQL